MAKIDARREQMFPKLSVAEVNRLRRFGDVRTYRAGDTLFRTGELSPGMFVIIDGSVKIERHDPFGRLDPIVEDGPGDFIGEISQLSGQPALVDAYAITDVSTLVIPSERLRAILIAEADLGDR